MGIDAAIMIGGSIAGQGLQAGMNKLMGADKGGAGGVDVAAGVGAANDILGKALKKSLNYSQNYTNKGVDTQKDYFGQATNALQSYLSDATNQANTNIQQGLKQSIATNAPVVNLGYDAMDKYKDSLGMSRAAMGTASLAQTIQNNPNLLDNVQKLQSSYQNLKAVYDQNGNLTGYTDPFTGKTVGALSRPNLTGDAFNPTNQNLNMGSAPVNNKETIQDLLGNKKIPKAFQAIGGGGGSSGQISNEEINQYILDTAKETGQMGPEEQERIAAMYKKLGADFGTVYFGKDSALHFKSGESMAHEIRSGDYNIYHGALKGETDFLGHSSQIDGSINGRIKYGLQDGEISQVYTEGKDLRNIALGLANTQINREQSAYDTAANSYQAITNAYNPYNQTYGLLQNSLGGMSAYSAAQALAAQQGIFGQARII